MDRLSTLVTPDVDGVRLDRALAELMPERSRSAYARLISEGRVLIDGRAALRASETVATGQRLEVDLPDPLPSTVESQDLPLEILFEDDDIVVLDKRAGIVVHPSAGHADQTLVNALLFHVRDLSGIGGKVRPGIVHRLDRDTSGVMIIAKNDEAHRALTAEWGTDRVRKEYTALVYGKPNPDHGSIDAPLGRDPHDRKRMAVVAGGRRAVTDFETIESLRYVALLRCRLRTGRTHQIRVHLKSIGHPIVGDPLYSGPQWRGIPDKQLQKALKSFARQALHASLIRFPHPRTGAMMTIEAPLPDDFATLLALLRMVP